MNKDIKKMIGSDANLTRKQATRLYLRVSKLINQKQTKQSNKSTNSAKS